MKYFKQSEAYMHYLLNMAQLRIIIIVLLAISFSAVISQNSESTELFSSTQDYWQDPSTETESPWPQPPCDPNGKIQSQNYPNVYPNNALCEWTISSPEPDYQVILWFDLPFKLEGGSGCPYDYVEIRDGPYPTSPLIGKFCGTSRPPLIASTSGQLHILFRSDGSETLKGFRANYELHISTTTVEPEASTAEGETFADDTTTQPPEYPCHGYDYGDGSGYIESQNHPYHYIDNAICNSVISSSQPDSQVEVYFASLFELQGGSGCPYDFVEFRDGPFPTSPLIGKYCGTNSPGYILTSSGHLHIRFQTDSSRTFRGFRAFYHTGADPPTEEATTSEGETSVAAETPTTTQPPEYPCEGYDYGGGSGFVQSQNFPYDYLNYAFCDWTISSFEPGYQVEIYFEEPFELEGGSGCPHDFVELRDGPLSSSPLIGKYCGTDSPRHIQSTSGHLHVRFQTDSSQTFSGFRAHYNTIFYTTTTTQPPEYPCEGYDYGGGSGYVQSQNFPYDYLNYAFCDWTINSFEPGSQVEVYFEAPFELQGGFGCPYDFVELRDGPLPNSPPIGKYCGTNSPGYIKSTSGHLHIRFQTDSSQTFLGFRAHYNTVFNTTTTAPVYNTTTTIIYPTTNTPGPSPTTTQTPQPSPSPGPTPSPIAGPGIVINNNNNMNVNFFDLSKLQTWISDFMRSLQNGTKLSK